MDGGHGARGLRVLVRVPLRAKGSYPTCAATSTAPAPRRPEAGLAEREDRKAAWETAAFRDASARFIKDRFGGLQLAAIVHKDGEGDLVVWGVEFRHGKGACSLGSKHAVGIGVPCKGSAPAGAYSFKRIETRVRAYLGHRIQHAFRATRTGAVRPKGGSYSLYHDGARGPVDDSQRRIPLILGVGGRVAFDELHSARFVVFKRLPWLDLPNKAGYADQCRDDDPPPHGIPPPFLALDL